MKDRKFHSASPVSGLTRRSFLSSAGAASASLAVATMVGTGVGAGLLSRPAAASRAANAMINGAHLSKADLIAVYKSRREMYLLRDGEMVRRYTVALGGSPVGHKFRQGDNRTPEGPYVLDWRNPNSQFHLSLHVSYPNDTDRSLAASRGVDPGGYIMIHGLPNGRGADEVQHPRRDWTNGCIAVTNEEMEEIWAKVDDGTGIVIFG
jgi:murein L,D-transpeptidase YafK